MSMRTARVRSRVCVAATLTFAFAGPLVWDGKIDSLIQPVQLPVTRILEADRLYAMLELGGLIERLETGDLELRPRVTVTFRGSAPSDQPEGSGVVDLRLPFPVVVVNP